MIHTGVSTLWWHAWIKRGRSGAPRGWFLGSYRTSSLSYPLAVLNRQKTTDNMAAMGRYADGKNTKKNKRHPLPDSPTPATSASTERRDDASLGEALASLLAGEDKVREAHARDSESLSMSSNMYKSEPPKPIPLTSRPSWADTVMGSESTLVAVKVRASTLLTA